MTALRDNRCKLCTRWQQASTQHAHRNLYIPPPSTPRTHQIKLPQAGVELQRFTQRGCTPVRYLVEALKRMCHTTCGSKHMTTSHQPPPPPDPQTPPPQPPQPEPLTPHPSTINPNPLAPNPLNTKHSTPPPLNPSSHRSPRTQLPPLTIKHALPMQPCNTHTPHVQTCTSQPLHPTPFHTPHSPTKVQSGRC